MSLPILHFFFFSLFWVNDLDLCSRLHCTVVDYQYLLHGMPVDSDSPNWVLFEFSYKHSFFCIIVCMFVIFFLIIILVWLLRKCRDIIHLISFGFLFSMFGIQSSLYSCLGQSLTRIVKAQRARMIPLRRGDGFLKR